MNLWHEPVTLLFYMKKTTSFKVLSQQDRLSLKYPFKMRTNLVLLVGTMFHLAVPTLAYSANTQQSPDESVKSIAPENIQIKGSIKDSKGEALIGVNVLFQWNNNRFQW